MLSISNPTDTDMVRHIKPINNQWSVIQPIGNIHHSHMYDRDLQW